MGRIHLAYYRHLAGLPESAVSGVAQAATAADFSALIEALVEQNGVLNIHGPSIHGAGSGEHQGESAAGVQREAITKRWRQGLGTEGGCQGGSRDAVTPLALSTQVDTTIAMRGGGEALPGKTVSPARPIIIKEAADPTLRCVLSWPSGKSSPPSTLTPFTLSSSGQLVFIMSPGDLKPLQREVERTVRCGDHEGYRKARTALTSAARGSPEASPERADLAIAKALYRAMPGLNIPSHSHSAGLGLGEAAELKPFKPSFVEPIFGESFLEEARAFREALTDFMPDHPLYAARRKNAARIKEFACEEDRREEQGKTPKPLTPAQRELVERFANDAKAAAWGQSKRGRRNYRFDLRGHDRGPDEVSDAYDALVSGVVSGKFDSSSTADFVRQGVRWELVNAARADKLRREERKCEWCGGTGIYQHAERGKELKTYNGGKRKVFGDVACGACKGKGKITRWLQVDLDGDFRPDDSGSHKSVWCVSSGTVGPETRASRSERVPDLRAVELPHTVEREKILAAVRKIVVEMDPGARNVLELYYWEDRTQQEIV